MDLKEYLNENGLNYRDLSEKLGIHPQSLKNIACGTRSPGLKLALRIEELTGGKVTPRDLIDQPDVRKKKTKSKPKRTKG